MSNPFEREEDETEYYREELEQAARNLADCKLNPEARAANHARLTGEELLINRISEPLYAYTFGYERGMTDQDYYLMARTADYEEARGAYYDYMESQ